MMAGAINEFALQLMQNGKLRICDKSKLLDKLSMEFLYRNNQHFNNKTFLTLGQLHCSGVIAQLSCLFLFNDMVRNPP